MVHVCDEGAMLKVFLAMLLGVAIFGAFGCASDSTTLESVPRTDGRGDKDCSGMLYSNGCDDCNPCTFDDWCDPDAWFEFVPPWCVEVAHLGVATCVHSDRSTPDGQINDCFPIAPVTDVRPGKCCVGTCIDNAEACSTVKPL